MPQSKTGTFRVCLQLPLHLEAPAALCKRLPELLKLVKAQQQSSRLARVPCWDSYAVPVLGGPRLAARATTRLWQVPAALAEARELRKGGWTWAREVLLPLPNVPQQVLEPLLGSGLGFWQPLCSRSCVVVSLVLRWSKQVLFVRSSEEPSKYLNVYIVSKIPVKIVKGGIFCVLEAILYACDSLWIQQIFSCRSLTFGKFCFICLEFPSA